jgi:mono/diheme cytochrome c family protein
MKKLNIAILAMAAMAFTFVVLPVSAQDMAAGKASYTKRCQTCHAADGSGNPGIAKALGIQFRALASADAQKATDVEMKKVISEGMGKMKGVSGVDAGEMNNIVAYVRSLKK